MLAEKPLTLKEIEDVASNQHKIKQQYYKEVAAQLEKFDNEIYRIRKGKISYQPKLVASLLAIAKELGNDALSSHVETLVGNEYALDVSLKVIVEKMDVKSYYCTIKSDIPQLSPLNVGYDDDDNFKIHFGEEQFRNKKYTKGNLQNTIKEKLANQLNRGKEISLCPTGNKNNLIDAHIEITNKLASYNLKPLFGVISLLISDSTSKIKLRMITSISANSEIASSGMNYVTHSYRNYVTYDSNVIENINTNYVTNLASYLKANEQNLIREKTEGDNDTIHLIKNHIESNKNFLQTNVKLSTTNSEKADCKTICGTVQLNISKHYLIFITVGKNDISYAIQKVDNNGYVFATIFEEHYVYHHTSVEKLYEEILTIYEKAKIIGVL